MEYYFCINLLIFSYIFLLLNETIAELMQKHFSVFPLRTFFSSVITVVANTTDGKEQVTDKKRGFSI